MQLKRLIKIDKYYLKCKRETYSKNTRKGIKKEKNI